MHEDELFYLLGLKKVEGIGNTLGKRLLKNFGSAQAIFEANKKKLLQIDGINEQKANHLLKKFDEKSVKQEIKALAKHNINTISPLAENYPLRCKEENDLPFILFYKGSLDNLTTKRIAVVGSRKCTVYGKTATESILEDIASYQPSIISGLAFGIDITAHRKAITLGLPTFAVLAHGLDTVYPNEHGKDVNKMIDKGYAIFSEYPPGAPADRVNFPMRNRIIAALSDLVLVSETDVKGGAMITAKVALSYNIEVGAIPGNINVPSAKGCNDLIRRNMANCIVEGKNIAEILNWDQQPAKQASLFLILNEEEQVIMDILATDPNGVHIDMINKSSNFATSTLANLLLTLELKNAIISLPGKKYAVK